MATADLKLIYGGGGSFVPSFFSGALQIAPGATGTILTITPPVGKKVRLTSLVVANLGSSETNVSILSAGVTVIGPLTLSSAGGTVVGTFTVGQTVNAGLANSIEYIESISSITITKSPGSTTVPVSYSYAFGD